MSGVRAKQVGQEQATYDQVREEVARINAEGGQADVFEITYKEPALRKTAGELRAAVRQVCQLFRWYVKSARERGLKDPAETEAHDWIARHYPSLAEFFRDDAYRHNMLAAASYGYTDVYYAHHMRKLDVVEMFERGEISETDRQARMARLDRELMQALKARAK